jgi:hypothetical protein
MIVVASDASMLRRILGMGTVAAVMEFGTPHADLGPPVFLALLGAVVVLEVVEALVPVERLFPSRHRVGMVLMKEPSVTHKLSGLLEIVELELEDLIPVNSVYDVDIVVF